MNVAVTGLNNVDNPGPGVPVIRALRDSGEFNGGITGLLYDIREPGAYLQTVTVVSYVIPYPSAGLDHLFDRLTDPLVVRVRLNLLSRFSLSRRWL
jgi:carbamoyl-phosphate synthase large subunit